MHFLVRAIVFHDGILASTLYDIPFRNPFGLLRRLIPKVRQLFLSLRKFQYSKLKQIF